MLINTRNVNSEVWARVDSANLRFVGFAYMVGEQVLERVDGTGKVYHGIRAHILTMLVRGLHKREACLSYVR